jgi:hypothetical protein
MLIESQQLSAKEINDLSIEDKRVIIKNNKLGEVGDTISIVYKNYRLVNVDRISIILAAARYYRLFGFTSPREFIEVWIEQNKAPMHSTYTYIHYFDLTE